MNEFLNAMKKTQNVTTTENGAEAYSSTLNACLDAFGSLGAMRFSDEETILDTFRKAFAEDPKTAIKMLFYMRDIRGGQGCRKVFRVIATWLANNFPKYITNNLSNFLLYGRGDDLLCLLDTPLRKDVTAFMAKQTLFDTENMEAGAPCSLMAKWLPSENTSSNNTKRYARMIINDWRTTPRIYRKLLSELRTYIKVVEQKMSAREWTAINYGAVPAKAAIRYSNAFEKHDESGYMKYLEDLADGKAKVNAASLFPVDIVSKAMDYYRKDRMLLNAMWKNLPNYLEDKEETGICVVDVSGSMSGTPMEVAISLGIYCADKCRGPFQNHFITFSARPKLVEVRGADIIEKVRNCQSADWGMNTNLEAVFDLILNTAKTNHCKQSDLPNKLYIISDMQFDQATRSYHSYGHSEPAHTFMDSMKEKYREAGYEMPIIVYWNVRASRCGMFQDTFQGQNCCMVSGYSASLFKSIIEGTTYEEEVKIDANGNKVIETKATVDPITVMMTTLNNERYNPVWVG